MKMQKSIQADSAGRVNLGKNYAGLLFILSSENYRLVLEPARIVSEAEFDQKQKPGALLLNDKEWAAFESLMEVDEEPTKELRKLMKNAKRR